MRRFQFTDEERSLIAKERFYHPNPRVQRRMEILWLKQHGETHQRIAELAGASRRTVQRVLDVFAEGRLEAVRQFHEKGRVNAFAPHCQSLEEEFRQRPPERGQGRRGGMRPHRATHRRSSSADSGTDLSA